jgi:hypothetical protein
LKAEQDAVITSASRSWPQPRVKPLKQLQPALKYCMKYRTWLNAAHILTGIREAAE